MEVISSPPVSAGQPTAVETPLDSKSPRIPGKLAFPKPERNKVCCCNSCGTWLVFQASREAELVNCPYCLLATILYLPEIQYSYPPEQTDLEIRKLGWGVTRMGYRCVAGRVVNHAKTNLDWVRIQFDLYDSAEKIIGTTSDSIMGLEPGGVWNFQAAIADANVVRASLPVLSSEYGKIKFVERFCAAPEALEQSKSSKVQSLPAANLDALRKSQALARAPLVISNEEVIWKG